MLATISLGAAQGVAGGAIAGHALATLIAVLGGAFLAKYINCRSTGSLSFSSTSFFSFAVSTSVAESQSQSTISAQFSEKERSRWSKWLLFLPGAISFGLGSWQIVRREEKIKMLDYRRKRLELEPLKFDNVESSSEELDHLEFRRVLCKGRFDEKRSIYVGPRSRSISRVTENGYYVFTPLLSISDEPGKYSLSAAVTKAKKDPEIA